MSSQPTLDPPRVEQPPRLTRSHEDRMVAGVAGGLGRHLGIDPIVIRLAFVVLALAGGGGVLAYLVAWIVMPDAPVGVPEPSTPGQPGAGASVAAGLLLIGLGGILLVDRLVPALAWRYVGPAALVVLGVLLLTRKGAPR
jgi:phage shock protein C